MYVVPPTRFVEPSESVATCSADPDVVTSTHPPTEAAGQAPLCATQATFSVVPTLAGDGSVPVTATWLATEPVAAETVGAATAVVETGELAVEHTSAPFQFLATT